MSETPPPPYGEQQPGQPYGQQPPSGQQPPYGQPQVPYGQPYAYGQPGYGMAVPDHPKATTVLILGICGLVVCGILAPFAWVMGNRTVEEIDASNGALGGRSTANAGRICGIVGTVIIAVSLVFFVGIFLMIAVGTLSSTSP